MFYCVFIFVIYSEYRVELAINLTEPLVRVESWSLAIQTGAVVNYVTQSVEDLCILCELNKLLRVQRNVNHPSNVCLDSLSIQISWAIRKTNPAWDTLKITGCAHRRVSGCVFEFDKEISCVTLDLMFIAPSVVIDLVPILTYLIRNLALILPTSPNLWMLFLFTTFYLL